MRFYKQPELSDYWYCDLRPYGLGRRSTGTSDKKEAMQRVSAWLAANGGVVKGAAKPSATLAGLIDRYLLWADTHKTYKSATRDSVILQQFLVCCGDVAVSDLTPSHIEQFQLQRAKRVSPSCVNRDMSSVRHMLDTKAVDWELIPAPICRRIKRMKMSKRLRESYTEAQIQKLFAATEEPFRSYWKVYAWTGMRRGEGNRLRWADVQDGWLRIRDPKERKDKCIPISAALRQVLDGMDHTSEYVIPVKDEVLTRRYTQDAAKAGIGGTLHKLRHSFASILLRNGVPIQVVRDLMGHSSLAITNLYAHASDEDKMASVNFFSA